MDLTKQKRVVSTGSSRSIMTRSQSGASVMKGDIAKFTFAKRKAESPMKTLNKKSVFRDLTNREAGKDTVCGKLQDGVTAAARRLAKTKISEQSTRNVKVPPKVKVNKALPKQNESVISSYFRVTKQAMRIPQSDAQKIKKHGDCSIKLADVQEKICKPPVAVQNELVHKPVKSVAQVDKNLQNKLSANEDKRESSTGKNQSRSPRESDISPSLSSLSTDQSTAAVIESPELDPTVPPKRTLPPGVEDFDAENWTDPCQVSHYATEIFNYFKNIETKFQIKDYMPYQHDLTSGMRAVVIDWMVELQENFELNHETLYLAVKLVDSYLSKATVKRDNLQLVAAAAIFIASKYDERFPPSVEDHLYVCEGAYNKSELMAMEINILKKMDFNLGFPISYRFLRRYARFGRVSMPTLTLARYILEYSLMDYNFVSESDSKLAASALLLALQMKGTNDWSPNLQYSSGYVIEDLKLTTLRLNTMLCRAGNSGSKLVSVKNKYSHKIFYEVAKMPLLEKLEFQ